jgi:hypothetical protein
MGLRGNITRCEPGNHASLHGVTYEHVKIVIAVFAMITSSIALLCIVRDTSPSMLGHHQSTIDQFDTFRAEKTTVPAGTIIISTSINTIETRSGHSTCMRAPSQRDGHTYISRQYTQTARQHQNAQSQHITYPRHESDSASYLIDATDRKCLVG